MDQLVNTVGEPVLWAVGAALVALLIAVVVAQLLSGRARARSEEHTETRVNELRSQLQQQGDHLHEGLRQHTEEIRTLVARHNDGVRAELQQMREEHARRSEELIARVEGQENRLGLVRTQSVLLQAAARTSKARLHLAEQDTGLAMRDLAEADASLQRASTLAPDQLKPEIAEVRRGLKELEQGVETRAFPVVSVEALADRIYTLVAASEEPDALHAHASRAAEPSSRDSGEPAA